MAKKKPVPIPVRAVRMFEQGYAPADVVKAAIPNAQGTGIVSMRTAQAWRRAWADSRKPGGRPIVEISEGVPATEGPPYSKIYQMIKDNPLTLSQISDKLDRGPETVQGWVDDMKALGYNIETTATGRMQVNTSEGGFVLPSDTVRTLADEAGQDFAIAVPSDLHVGSRKQQITALYRFCQIAREEYGVRDFIVPGDISAGKNVYRGQDKEVYAETGDQQELALERTVPIEPDDRWYVMGGNHDWSHVKNTGRDLVYRFCEKYENMSFLGYSQFDLSLTDRFKARLWHPRGGVPYAKSYRMQKGIEALVPDILRDALSDQRVPHGWLLLIGHLHISAFLPGVEVCAAQVGCFEGQTMWMKEGALVPAIGGWIFRIRVTDSGLVHRIEPIWVGFREIDDDWKNYPNLLFDRTNEAEEVEPLFRGISEPPVLANPS